MKKTIVISGICICLLIVVTIQCEYSATINTDPRGNSYAGAKACAKCHAAIYDSYQHTAHYLASLPATEKTIHGSFAEGFNVFNVNKNQKVVMEKLDSGFFQTYYLNGKLKEKHRFDIVFGGIKGESYLYWQGNELNQLPLSYFNLQKMWSTSPGFGFNFLDYNQARSIGKQCLECHVSYISNSPGETPALKGGESFDKSSLVYSIDCERCHGPGTQHVSFHIENPESKEANSITSYRFLNPVQKIDMCAVCHSGKPTKLVRSIFEFIPGDTFSKFKQPEFYKHPDTSSLDVHGNQLQLLQSSKCYMFSQLNCTTCHNPHQNTRGNNALYTQKCFNCHNDLTANTCKLKNKVSNEVLQLNCISCHMPALPSKAISVQVSDTMPSIRFFVHTHHIAIYPQETKKVLRYIFK